MVHLVVEMHSNGNSIYWEFTSQNDFHIVVQSPAHGSSVLRKPVTQSLRLVEKKSRWQREKKYRKRGGKKKLIRPSSGRQPRDKSRGLCLAHAGKTKDTWSNKGSSRLQRPSSCSCSPPAHCHCTRVRAQINIANCEDRLLFFGDDRCSSR